MNKWSLLLFSVLGLLLSTTSEPNFVDGRFGCCERTTRTLFSDTRLPIYEPHCAYNTFTEITQLTSPKRDTRYASKNVDLKRSSPSDGRRRQFEERRISSDGRSRVLSNDVFDLEDTTLSNTRNRKALREVNVLQMRKKLKSFSRDNLRENHVERSRSHKNANLWNTMERNSRERVFNIEEHSIIPANRFRRNDRMENVNLIKRNQERFTRHTFGIRTNIMPNSRENIDEMRLSLIQKREGKREMERSILDINSKRKVFRDARLTSDVSRNIRDYRRLSVRDNSIEKIYESESRTDVRRNIDMDVNLNVYGRSNDEDISKQVLTRNINKNVVIRVQNGRLTRLDKSFSRSGTIQRENEGLENRIYEKRLFEERYLNLRALRQNSYVSSRPEVRQVRIYNDRNIEDGEDKSTVFTERTERNSVQRRNIKIRDYNREITEEYRTTRITPQNKDSLAKKRAISSNLHNRRSEATRDTVLERREREYSRYSLENENEIILVQRRIRQIKNSYDADKLREARNTQRRFIRNNAMGQEINNNRQIYDNDDTISKRVNWNYDNRKLERERLTRTGIRVSQIRSIQREDQYIMHNDNTRVLNIRENGLREDPNYNRRSVSNTNKNVEKQRARTYDDKLGGEEFRQSLLHGTERSFDESRIRQGRDNSAFRREYRLNEEQTIERVLNRIDRNRDYLVESNISMMSRFGNNRFYGLIKNTVIVLQRRENYEVKYRSVPKNERIFDQTRVRYVRDLNNEYLEKKENARTNRMNNRPSFNDEHNSENILTRNRNGEIAKRSERDRLSSNNKRSFYLRMIQRQDGNRMQNDFNQLMNRRLVRQDFDNYRVVENRRAGTPRERYDFRNILTLETKRSFDERRIKQFRDNREYRINEIRILTENVNNVIERQETRIRSEVDVDHQNQNTRSTLILLQRREKEEARLMRRNEREFEQDRNGIVRNRREFNRIENHSRNNRITKIRGTKSINERLNISNARNNLVTRYIESEVGFRDSDETSHERRTERVTRNIARNGMERTIRSMRFNQRTSINNRVLLEGRSEKQKDVNRELDYRSVRSHRGLDNSEQRDNTINVRKNEREDNRIRDSQDRIRDIRLSYGSQISKNSRLITTRRTNKEKPVPLATEHKAQSDSQDFEMNLQYIFYLLQGLYILGLFTKYTKESDGIQKRTRLSNLFPLFSILKVH